MAQNNEKASQYDLARTLYFQSDYTIKRIAEAAGVSQDTVGDWARRDNWKELKKARSMTNERLLADLQAEVQEINNLIQSREPGKRFASAAEADARVKIINSIKKLSDTAALPQIVDAVMKLVNYLKLYHPELAKQLGNPIAQFLREESAKLQQ